MELGLALLFIAFGFPGAVWPYELVRFSEQLQAIGSKRSLSEVEPADWKVYLTRVVGFLVLVLGLSMLVVGVVGSLSS